MSFFDKKNTGFSSSVFAEKSIKSRTAQIEVTSDYFTNAFSIPFAILMTGDIWKYSLAKIALDFPSFLVTSDLRMRGENDLIFQF